MRTTDTTLNRRGFLQAGLTAAAVAGSLGADAAPAGKTISLAETGLPMRPFGKTGHTLPVLGHGGSAMMGREYGYYHLTEVPSLDKRIAMVRDAYDKGVRYFDTARIYQECESIMGEALKDVADDLYLASKVLVNKPEDVRPSVEQSLQELQVDRIDCMQIHGPSIERLKYDGAMKLH